MTAVLQLQQDIARHLEVRTTVTAEQLRDLMKQTDLRRLTNRTVSSGYGDQGDKRRRATRKTFER
jgi:hypothetical protein